MMRRKALVILALAAVTVLAQKPWREYPAFEYNSFPAPPDFAEKTEFVWGRLMYPNGAFGFGRRGFGGSYWREGGRGIFWTMDYPRSDRHLMLALRRLTRVNARSVEEPVNLEDGEGYNWPWLYGVEVGHWDLGDDLSKKLREYLLRGGFLMVDDFHGTYEWEVFMQSMQKVFPDRPVVDLDDKDPIFHSTYDLDDRIQVPGAQAWLGRGVTYEQDGVQAKWRGIYDDHNRVMVAICHNMDLGDSWEHADNPQYPEKFSALGIRIATNYVVYAMTH